MLEYTSQRLTVQRFSRGWMLLRAIRFLLNRTRFSNRHPIGLEKTVHYN